MPFYHIKPYLFDVVCALYGRTPSNTKHCNQISKGLTQQFSCKFNQGIKNHYFPLLKRSVCVVLFIVQFKNFEKLSAFIHNILLLVQKARSQKKKSTRTSNQKCFDNLCNCAYRYVYYIYVHTHFFFGISIKTEHLNIMA